MPSQQERETGLLPVNPGPVLSVLNLPYAGTQGHAAPLQTQTVHETQ